VQYTHARCHSLFRLAQQEGLLKPKEPQSADRISDWISNGLHDIEISWIGADGHLRTHHPTEQQFISQLVHTLDEIVRLDASLNATVGLQLAHGLSQSFQAFYAACRIWDETRLALPELVHARLGLIGITQSVLRSLLIDVIGTAAPIEL
jgi:arginyl-tRNA synthetase